MLRSGYILRNLLIFLACIFTAIFEAFGAQDPGSINNRKLKVAILGASFNPITNGHLQMVDFLIEYGGFDKVWLMPAYGHTVKNLDEGTTLLNHRIAMVEVAIEGREDVSLFDYEVRHKLSGSTLETFQLLKKDTVYRNYDFFFVIGADNAIDIHRWVNYQQLVAEVNFVVVPRVGYDFSSIDKSIWDFKERHLYLDHAIGPYSGVSSSLVRNLVKIGDYKKINELVPKKVSQYIDSHNLYR